ncbi:glycoside hydrolase domain-containing protein [Streptomyces antimycoticus]|uniref:glycoside hydrolase domain-containing protein n=1 Tax=Streptomyces antimycoticus TaxID=68175 RepID=UPI00382F4B3B
MYLWAGAPAKAATAVRAAMTLFTTGPDGMTGNDDLGTMSAWYVFSSLGLYPTMSGGDFLALSSPQFASSVVRIGHYGARQGGTLTVTAPGASDAKRYVRSVSLGGRQVARTGWTGDRWPTAGSRPTGCPRSRRPGAPARARSRRRWAPPARADTGRLWCRF